MATSSDEFILGGLFLVCGLFFLAFRWLLHNTSLGQTMREADREVETVFGLSSLEMIRLMALGCLSLGTVLTIVAFVAYSGP